MYKTFYLLFGRLEGVNRAFRGVRSLETLESEFTILSGGGAGCLVSSLTNESKSKSGLTNDESVRTICGGDGNLRRM
jgi:hypothetical protein